MRTVNLLLGVSERRLNNLIEALVLDVCYNQAAIACTRATRADEFSRQGCSPGFHLIIVSPDNLLPAPSRRGSRVAIEDAVDALRTIKNRCGTAVIALSASEDEDASLWEAGSDSVLRLPLNREQLKSEVCRLLGISELAEEPAREELVSRWSLSEALSRGWERLKSA
ncbi:MAG TPA: hypothetical protein VN578_10305 [Candidatus Binatia bacterium]|jgi:hypothetical protein|nr:hypothetical protein [Candidatus Binatia bacterium]